MANEEQKEALETLRYGLEVSKLLLGLAHYENLQNSDEELIRKGRWFLKQREDLLYKFVSDNLAGLKPSIAVDLRIAEKGVFFGRGEENSEKVQAYNRAISEGLAKLAVDKSKITSISMGEADIKRCITSLASSATVEGVPFEVVCTSPKVKGGPTFPRKWLRLAAETIGESSKEEQLITDIQGAQESAEKLKDAQARIAQGVGDPEVNERDKAKALAEIKEAATSSSDSSAVMGAVASTLGKGGTHRSEVGKRLGLSPEQEDAMLVTGKSIIAAGAGSGKTRVLAGKIVHLLESGVAPDQIIASSFTRKSAMELKERVVSYGGGAISLNDSGFGTTHSISKKILNTVEPTYLANKTLIEDDTLLREAMLQVSLLPDIDVAPFAGPVSYKDDVIIKEQLTVEDLALQAIVSGALSLARYMKDSKGWKPWIQSDLDVFEPIEDKKLSDLTQGQKDAVNKFLDGTNRGQKLLAKLSKLMPSVNTMYRIAAVSDDVKNLEAVEGMEEGESEVPPVNQWFNMGMGAEEKPKTILLHISKMKADMISWSEAYDKDKSYMNTVYGAYEWLKENRNMIDHEDYMIRCIQALVQTPARLKEVQDQFKYILIDEAQDLNKTQHILFGLIAGAYDTETLNMKSDGSMTAHTYCFIGDDKQAIYEFRGANPDTFTENSDLRQGSFETKLITSNFRSGTNIVNAANQLIAHNDRQIPMVCQAQNVRGQGAIQSMSVEDANAGAKFTLDAIMRDMEETGGFDTWSEDYPKYGVAARTNAEIADYIMHCVANDIKFSAKPGINPFKNKVYDFLFNLLDIGGDAKALTRSIFKTKDYFDFGLDAQFAKYLKAQASGTKIGGKKVSIIDYFFNQDVPVVYTSKTHAFRNTTFVVPYRDTLRRIRGIVKNAPNVNDLIRDLLNLTITDVKGSTYTISNYLLTLQKLEQSKEASTLDGKESGTEEMSREDLESKVDSVVDIFRKLLSNGDTVEESIEFINLIRGKATKLNVDEDKKNKAVVLDTCHGWKGLEAKHVWIPMESGKFPAEAREDEDPEAKLASERRLAYVALTRGRDSVTILSPRKNSKGDVSESRFLAEACIKPMTSALPYAPEDAQKIRNAKIASDSVLVDMILSDNLSDRDMAMFFRSYRG